jgi:hypothetical protein
MSSYSLAFDEAKERNSGGNRSGLGDSRSISHTTTPTFPPRFTLQQRPHLLGHRVRRISDGQGAALVDDLFCGVVAFDAGETGVLRMRRVWEGEKRFGGGDG